MTCHGAWLASQYQLWRRIRSCLLPYLHVHIASPMTYVPFVITCIVDGTEKEAVSDALLALLSCAGL